MMLALSVEPAPADELVGTFSNYGRCEVGRTVRPSPVRRAQVAVRPTSSAQAVAAVLTPLEQAVVALATMDTRKSVQMPGRFTSLLFRIFGGRPANQLADPRLEALRRFVVLVRTQKRSVRDAGESQVIRAAGFSSEAEAEVRRLLRTMSNR